MPDTPPPEPTSTDAPETDAAVARGEIPHRTSDGVDAIPGPPPRWAVHRRMYDWVLSFAHHRHSSTALFAFSFTESSFFPVPPDVLLGPLCLGKRNKAMWFAFICTLGSVLGAYLGYLIGFSAIGLVESIPGVHMGPEDDAGWGSVNGLRNAFDAYGQWFVFIAALTPIPFKLLTITAGFAEMSLLPFTLACVIGRAARFFAVAGVFWWVGPKAAPLIDKYFNWLTLAFVVLLIGGVLILKVL